MARHFAKVSEEEIVVINEAAFFNPSDLVNTGSVKSSEYIPRREAFGIYPPLFSCILFAFCQKCTNLYDLNPFFGKISTVIKETRK